MSQRIIYEIGQRLNPESRLTFIKEVEPHIQPSGKHQRQSLFRCDCGNEKVLSINNVKSGHSLSCGCRGVQILSERSITHGMAGTKIYGIWKAMIQRCTNPNNKHYCNYGGRGIEVCEEWLSFKVFYADMGNKPQGLTLERKNNSLGYDPDNCKWGSREDQARNRRSNHNLTLNEKTQTIAAWASDLGINSRTIASRVRRGWSDERALTPSGAVR